MHGQHGKATHLNHAWAMPAFNDDYYKSIRQNLHPPRNLIYKPFPSEQGLNIKKEALDLSSSKV